MKLHLGVQKNKYETDTYSQKKKKSETNPYYSTKYTRNSLFLNNSSCVVGCRFNICCEIIVASQITKQITINIKKYIYFIYKYTCDLPNYARAFNKIYDTK